MERRKPDDADSNPRPIERELGSADVERAAKKEPMQA